MNMSQNRLSAQDRKDLDKYTKYLAFKTVQAIVESRLGAKIKTKSKPHSSGSDWFNLSIRDIPEVLAEAKKSLAGQIPVVGLGMVVEISIKGANGQSVIMESWYLEMTEQCDPSARVTYTVYSRMSLLLKSLIAVTRVTPMWKMASMQPQCNYVVCYRVFMGEPQVDFTDIHRETVKVGQVGTPIGTLVLSVTYRTSLIIPSLNGTSKDNQFMVKSDHFKPDMSPKRAQRPSHTAFHQDNRSIVDELAAACQDIHPATDLPQNPFTKGDEIRANDNGSSPTCASNRHVNFGERMPVAAFAKALTVDKDDPRIFMKNYFCNLVPLVDEEPSNANGQSKNCFNNNLVGDNNNRNTPVPNAAEDADSRSDTDAQKSSSDASGADDFILVNLNAPFAQPRERSSSDIGAVYREFQSAPALSSFSSLLSLADQVEDITRQIASFESSVPVYDEFVESLHQDETNN